MHIFKAINQDAEKNRLMQLLIQEQTPIQLRDKSDNNFTIKASGLNSNGELQCPHNEDLISKLTPKTKLSGSFAVKGEKYLFDTKLLVDDGGIYLPVLNLFHLQRRKDYRYVIPQGYSAQFAITRLNHLTADHSCKLLDLSTEGCALEMNIADANLNLHDLVDAKIILGDRAPIVVQGVIKNIRMKNDLDLILGVEFNHMAHASEGQIITALTDLQRDIYLRKAG